VIRILASGVLIATVLPACGGGGAATKSGSDPVSTVQAYMSAVRGGDQNAGANLLQQKSDEKLLPPTPASVYMSKHKGASWQVVPVAFAGQQVTSACLVLHQICLVTVKAGSSSPVYFQFALENRYSTSPPWQIMGVDEEKVAGDLLPKGNEAISSQ